MSGGWIKAWRSMIDHPALQRADELGIWTTLLFGAAHKNTRVRCRGVIYNLDRGQLVISLRRLAKKMGVRYGRLREVIKLLKNEHMIALTSNTAATVITICNYNKFQDSPIPNNTDSTHVSAHIEQEEQHADDARASLDANAEQTARVHHRVCEIVGVDPNKNANYMPWSRVAAWLRHGCDPELDIYPTVAAVMTRRAGQPVPGSLAYFTDAVVSARCIRLRPISESEISDETRLDDIGPDQGFATGFTTDIHRRPSRGGKEPLGRAEVVALVTARRARHERDVG